MTNRNESPQEYHQAHFLDSIGEYMHRDYFSVYVHENKDYDKDKEDKQDDLEDNDYEVGLYDNFKPL